MQATLVTSPEGHEKLRRRVKGQALEGDFRVLVQGRGVALDPQVGELLNAWDARRHGWGLATRRNTPHGFGRSLMLNDQSTMQNCALVLADDAEIRAVIVGVIETNRARHRLGVVHVPSFRLTEFTVDYSAFISDGRPETLEAARQYLTKLAEIGAVDAVQLRYVEAGSPWQQVVTDQRAAGMRWFEVPSSRWVARLTDPATGQRVEHGSSKTRSTHRRKDKQLESHFEGAVEVKAVATSADVDEFIRVASGIFKQTWHAAFGPGIHEGMRDYLKELADDGVLRAYVLSAKDAPIAYVMGDLYSGTYYLWDTAYLPEYAKFSAGTYLFRRMFEDLAGIGAVKFDFGWGDFDYKKVLGGEQVEDRDIHLYARRLIPSVVYALGSVFSRAEVHLKRIAKTYDLKNGVHRVWRKAKMLVPGRQAARPA